MGLFEDQFEWHTPSECGEIGCFGIAFGKLHAGDVVFADHQIGAEQSFVVNDEARWNKNEPAP